MYYMMIYFGVSLCQFFTGTVLCVSVHSSFLQVTATDGDSGETVTYSITGVCVCVIKKTIPFKRPVKCPNSYQIILLFQISTTLNLILSLNVSGTSWSGFYA